MANIIWSENAKETFETALTYIAQSSFTNAELVYERAIATLSHLEAFSLGVPGPKGYMKLYIPKTSYFVVFSRNAKDEVLLHSFVHTSRDWNNIDWGKPIVEHSTPTKTL